MVLPVKMDWKKIAVVLVGILGWMPLSYAWTDHSCGATYEKKDSVAVVRMLQQAVNLNDKPDSWMLWFGKKLTGIPYVGGTLDKGTSEQLVVNLHELDCTTFVETVLALSLCAEAHQTTFAAFCDYLRKVRYIGGEVSYVKRQHYFTVWIDENVKAGIVKNICPNPPFVAVQQVNLDWMSTHVGSYWMLKSHPGWLEGIKRMEASVSGNRYRYIPKAQIANTAVFRSTIKDGDIIAIITNKKGLDTTHVGIASWHKDGLHLLNASSIRKKVVDEPMLLRTYMQKRSVQIGIRVCRPIL